MTSQKKIKKPSVGVNHKYLVKCVQNKEIQLSASMLGNNYKSKLAVIKGRNNNESKLVTTKGST